MPFVKLFSVSAKFSATKYLEEVFILKLTRLSFLVIRVPKYQFANNITIIIFILMIKQILYISCVKFIKHFPT